MWLLARMQSREMPSPPCLQVTGVAADPRRQGTHTVAIGCLLGDGQPGACISRGCKGAGPGVTGTRKEEDGKKIGAGCRGDCSSSCKADLVAIVEACSFSSAVQGGRALLVRNVSVCVKGRRRSCFGSPSQKRGEGGQGALAIC